MSESLVLGPLLSVESDSKYVVCFLSKTESNFSVQFNEKRVEAKKIGNLKSGFFYRVCLSIEQTNNSTKINYRIIDTKYGRIVKDSHERQLWQFYIPSKEEKIKFAMISANDISNINNKHLKEPYSLLLMDGEHINVEELWTNVIELFIWSKLNNNEKTKVKTSKKLANKISDFYENQYLKKWNEKEMALALSSIPTLMMWDDHDIFEGYDKYSKEIANCDIYKCIFKTARKYFEIFQLRTIKNETLLTKDRTHFSYAFKFRNQYILALDKFSQRTSYQTMGKEQLRMINSYVDEKIKDDKILVLSKSKDRDFH